MWYVRSLRSFLPRDDIVFRHCEARSNLGVLGEITSSFLPRDDIVFRHRESRSILGVLVRSLLVPPHDDIVFPPSRGTKQSELYWKSIRRLPHLVRKVYNLLFTFGTASSYFIIIYSDALSSMIAKGLPLVALGYSIPKIAAMVGAISTISDRS